MTLQKRNSSIELLRIISMLVIVIYHYNAREFGLYVVSTTRVGESDLLLKLLTHSIGKLGVPIFVFISGWFGMNYNKKRFWEIITMCAFYAALSTIALLTTYGIVRPKDILFFLNDWWFIAAYICVYLLSPGINHMFEKAGKWQMLIVVISFYYISFGDYFQKEANVGGLYQMFTMYLSARWLRLYASNLLLKHWIKLLLGTIILRLGLIVVGYCTHHLGILPYINSYVCPITILTAAATFIGFSKIQFQSKVINLLASSSLAVYLFSEGTFGKIFFTSWFPQKSFHLMNFIIGAIIVYFTIFAIDLFRKQITNWLILNKMK